MHFCSTFLLDFGKFVDPVCPKVEGKPSDCLVLLPSCAKDQRLKSESYPGKTCRLSDVGNNSSCPR